MAAFASSAFAIAAFSVAAFSFDAGVPEPVQPPINGGAYGDVSKKQIKKKKKYDQYITYTASPKQAYKELVENKAVPEEIKADAVAVISGFAKQDTKLSATPAISSIDWAAFNENEAAVSRMVELLKVAIRIQLDDEQDIETLLLLM